MTGPTAAPNRFPYYEHRTMAEVRRDREYAEREYERRAFAGEAAA